jgi:subtilase family serine protease
MIAISRRCSVARLPKAVCLVPFLFVAVVSFAQSAQSRIAQAIDNAQFAQVQGSAHPLARPQFDRGLADGNMRLQNASIVFRLSAAQQQELGTLLAQQQDRTSPNYHKWLTARQYAERFGMTLADIAKVSAWLTSQGLTVEGAGGNRNRILFSGTAAKIQSAFHTEIHNYAVNGETHFANAGALSVPAAFSNLVLNVRGLNNFRPKPRHTAFRKLSDSPQLNAAGGFHLVAPEDFATIYDVQALYDQGIDGTGITIAVVGQTAVTMSDITNFRSAAGLSTNNPTVVVVPSTGTPVFTDADDLGESDLDLEWSGAVARNATILFVVVGPSDPSGAFDSFAWAIDPSNNPNVSLPPLGQVISISYGACEAANGTLFEQEVQQAVQSANSQGTTVTAASGDSGAADCDGNVASAVQGLAVDVPAAVPEVTAVGGTEFSADKTAPATYWNPTQDAHDGSALQYIPEGIWNDTSLEGTLTAGGGGVSTFFAVPSWQSGIAGLVTTGRNVPDVVLNASNNHDPYVFCTTPPSTVAACSNGFGNSQNQLDAVGGTSVGAPTFAGIVALLDQAVDSTGLGNVNAGLYPLMGTTPGAFHDVTLGNNIVPCTVGKPTTGPASLRCPSGGSFGYSATTGFDQVSGLGSIDANAMVTGWPGFSTQATYTLGGTPVTIASPGVMGTSTVTVTSVNGFNGTVTLNCTPPASADLITCSITPSVTLSGASAPATLTINTTAAHAVLGNNHPSGMGWFAVSGGGLLAGVLVLGIPSRRRKATAVFGMVLLSFAVTGIGCGGGSSSSNMGPLNPGTPAGSYKVVVTAVSGSITRTTNVSITVN